MKNRNKFLSSAMALGFASQLSLGAVAPVVHAAETNKWAGLGSALGSLGDALEEAGVTQDSIEDYWATNGENISGAIDDAYNDALAEAETAGALGDVVDSSDTLVESATGLGDAITDALEESSKADTSGLENALTGLAGTVESAVEQSGLKDVLTQLADQVDTDELQADINAAVDSFNDKVNAYIDEKLTESGVDTNELKENITGALAELENLKDADVEDFIGGLLEQVEIPDALTGALEDLESLKDVTAEDFIGGLLEEVGVPDALTGVVDGLTGIVGTVDENTTADSILGSLGVYGETLLGTGFGATTEELNSLADSMGQISGYLNQLTDGFSDEDDNSVVTTEKVESLLADLVGLVDDVDASASANLDSLLAQLVDKLEEYVETEDDDIEDDDIEDDDIEDDDNEDDDNEDDDNEDDDIEDDDIEDDDIEDDDIEDDDIEDDETDDVTPSPEVSTPSPEVETPSPEVETPSPEVETPSPEAETPSPEVETPSPDVETPSPEVETPSPEAETPENNASDNDSSDSSSEDSVMDLVILDGDTVEIQLATRTVNGVAVAELSNVTVAQALESLREVGVTSLSLDLTGKTATQVNLSSTALTSIVAAGVDMVLVSSVATVEMDNSTLGSILAQLNGAQVEIKLATLKTSALNTAQKEAFAGKTRPMIEFSVGSKGKALSNFGEGVKLTVPVALPTSADANSVAVVALDSEGETTTLETTFANNGATFQASGSSIFVADYD